MEALIKAQLGFLTRVLLPDLMAQTATSRQTLTRPQPASQAGLAREDAWWGEETACAVAGAWMLALTVASTLEDRGLVPPVLTSAEVHTAFCEPRTLLCVYLRALSMRPVLREVLGPRHSPIWCLVPSAPVAAKLVEFFREATPELRSGPGPGGRLTTSTRFLGDLYQALSEPTRKVYAFVQTPDFVEDFMLERTLEPAVARYGLDATVMDPTCGAGHFLVGAFARLFDHHVKAHPEAPRLALAKKVLGQVYGVDINPMAAALARLRLVLAVCEVAGCGLEDVASRVPNVVVADSLLWDARTHDDLAALVEAS